ncbi:hypothetical protein LJR231_003655 [Phyllobacterium sp. LjRoot231]|uniref:hypothetical protein n=1 Tax=Phyllobacterium sp. LjRoot231 TaxID=3342289 RepID=UPI003ED142D5
MKRLTAILVLLTALSIGWVPVSAAPGRLAAELGSHDVVAAGAVAAGALQAPVHTPNGCAGKQHHCPGDAKQQHPAVCAACVGVPAIMFVTPVAGQPKIIIPRASELPLVALDNAPLPRPPRI